MTLRLSAVFLGLCFPILVSAQSLVTYELVDGAAGDQAGHSISGTLTLDPSCGSSCDNFSVQSFAYTVTGPNGTQFVTSDVVPGDLKALLLNDSGTFVATPTELTFNFDKQLAGGEQAVFDMAGLAWTKDPPNAHVPNGTYYNFGDNGQVWWENHPTGTVTIARVVPEPAANTLVLSAGIVLLAQSRWRRRK